MNSAFFRTVLAPFVVRGMLLITLLALSPPALAQEFSVLGGMMEDPDNRKNSYAWQLEYLEGLGEHFAATFSYLNEGHIPNHHRDGHTIQLWGRTSLLDRRLSLAVGAGPYYYYDTTAGTAPGSFTNEHGWAGMATFAATWYTESRWLFQLRTNWVGIGRSFDTLTAVAGIGYQLESPLKPGPVPKAPLQEEKTTNNEITVFIGRTVANSFHSEHSVATSIEYRRGLSRYVDWTVAWIYEGDNRLVRRDGLTTQLWAVRQFLDDRIALGLGGGLYFALDTYNGLLSDNVTNKVVSGIVTMSASYRFPLPWDARISWNRVVTNYDRDTDVILGGIGYRF